MTLETVTGLSVDVLVMLGYATLATTISRWLTGVQHQRILNRLSWWYVYRCRRSDGQLPAQLKALKLKGHLQ